MHKTIDCVGVFDLEYSAKQHSLPELLKSLLNQPLITKVLKLICIYAVVDLHSSFVLF